MGSAYRHVGHVNYDADSASPLVIGDFTVMKGWKGNPDGNDDNEVIDIGSGKVFTCDLELTAPDVFVNGEDEIVLMAEADNNDGLLESYSLEDLQAPLGAKPEDPETWEIDVPSGAIVVNIAYNATPEKGASTKGLNKLCWNEDLPFLPKAAPKEPYYSTDDDNPDWAGHCIVPVKPGKYRVAMDEIEGDEGDFMRVVLRRKR